MLRLPKKPIIWLSIREQGIGKIVFYVNAINGGGAERVMVNLAKFFSENGYDTTLVTSFSGYMELSISADRKAFDIGRNGNKAIAHKEEHKQN